MDEGNKPQFDEDELVKVWLMPPHYYKKGMPHMSNVKVYLRGNLVKQYRCGNTCCWRNVRADLHQLRALARNRGDKGSIEIYAIVPKEVVELGKERDLPMDIVDITPRFKKPIL